MTYQVETIMHHGIFGSNFTDSMLTTYHILQDEYQSLHVSVAGFASWENAVTHPARAPIWLYP